MMGFLVCIVNDKITSLSFIKYIVVITIIYFVCYIGRYVVEKFYITGSFCEKYSFKTESRTLQTYLIIFSEYEQIFTLPSNRRKEKDAFSNALYEEMLILYKVAIHYWNYICSIFICSWFVSFIHVKNPK